MAVRSAAPDIDAAVRSAANAGSAIAAIISFCVNHDQSSPADASGAARTIRRTARAAARRGHHQIELGDDGPELRPPRVHLRRRQARLQRRQGGQERVRARYRRIVVAVLAAYFYYSGTVEERNLTAAFPTAYPEYKSRTKMLIPFLL